MGRGSLIFFFSGNVEDLKGKGEVMGAGNGEVCMMLREKS